MSGEPGMSDSVRGRKRSSKYVNTEGKRVIPDKFHTLEDVQEAIRKQGLESCNLIFAIEEYRLSSGDGMVDTVSGRNSNGENVYQEHKRVIRDEFHTLEDVQEAMKKQGLESCNIIFGIDYTTSNKSQGINTFGGESLHKIAKGVINPYQKMICILGETLEPFDEDGMIPVFGFGDQKSRDKTVFELKPGGHCEGFSEVLDVYNEVTPTVKLGGPTNFAPLIDKAVEIVKETNQYHILVIVADGQLSSESPTKKALIEASKYPLSVIVVGVGDGPWGAMKKFDDCLSDREFDNFQFVYLHEVMDDNPDNSEAAFALHALMEIPEQYKYLKEKGLI